MKTDKQFREIKMILKYLLPEDDRHTVIAGRTRIDIIPDSLVTYKIPCNNRASPCKIFFRYFGLKQENLDPKI
jgi:hypothetical protein